MTAHQSPQPIVPTISTDGGAAGDMARVCVIALDETNGVGGGLRLEAGGSPVVGSASDGLEVWACLNSSSSATGDELRTAVRSAAKVVSADTVSVDVTSLSGSVGEVTIVRSVVTGVLEAAYRYRATEWPSHVNIVGLPPRDSDAATRRAAHDAALEARAVIVTRDLVNDPPSDLFPGAFADRIREIAEGSSVRAAIWDQRDLATERMGGLIAVGRGSERQPCLVRLDYEPTVVGSEVRHLVLVGKGVTFDSGGLSLKSPEAMIDMKADMAGAAAIVGMMSTLAALEPRHRVTALLPLAENMPGPDATRIGDIVSTRSGRTIEVLNTDFEGRVLLADALTLASELSPDAVIDLATLTDSAVLALGDEVAALFSNDDDLAARVTCAATEVGESVWRMPLLDQYSGQLKSNLADPRNFPVSRSARSITAALFLREFVRRDVPWVHIDMAGPAMAGAIGGRSATGFGARTLCRLVAHCFDTYPRKTDPSARRKVLA